MRIGLSGAQSVGKTTLMNALKKEKFFKGYSFCEEITRRVKNYGLPINEKGNDLTQKLIMMHHIANTFMNDNMLTDRTVLDCVVYSMFLYEERQINDRTLNDMLHVFSKLWPTYDYIFYIEPEFDIVGDGVRSDDKIFRDRIVKQFESLIAGHKLNIIRISGSVQERVDTVMNILEGR